VPTELKARKASSIVQAILSLFSPHQKLVLSEKASNVTGSSHSNKVTLKTRIVLQKLLFRDPK
jgi:hypothetical protein